MSVEIKSEREMKLLGRRDLELVLKHEGNQPSRKEAIDLISKHLKAPKNSIAIVKMTASAEERALKIHCHIYDDEESMKLVERKHVLTRASPKTKEVKETKKETEETKQAEKPKEAKGAEEASS